MTYARKFGWIEFIENLFHRKKWIEPIDEIIETINYDGDPWDYTVEVKDGDYGNHLAECQLEEIKLQRIEDEERWG